MSHSRWEGMRPILGADDRHLETQMAYVDGYLICIEDMFKDLKEILTKHPVPTEAEELAHLLRKRLARSRTESHRTMRALKRAAAKPPGEPSDT